MERSTLSRRRFIKILTATASTILLTPSESYAQNPPETIPSPTVPPVLEFRAPESIQPNRRTMTPVFAPMPTAQPPQWTGEARITFYCLKGETASQTPVREGVIATDPKFISTGSRVDIEGLGSDFSAEDTGHGVKGWHIDLWMADCEKAIESGSQYRRIRVR